MCVQRKRKRGCGSKRSELYEFDPKHCFILNYYFSFSDVHEHVSWLTNKMEGTVTELSNSLKRLEDSTAVKHGQLVAMVTTAIENKQATLEERMHQLEQVQLIMSAVRLH